MNREGKDWKGGIPGSVKEKLARGGDVAQLVERRTGTPLTQLRFPRGRTGFFSQGQLSLQILLRVSVHPRVQSHSLTLVRTLKGL